LTVKTSVWRDFLDFDMRFNSSVRHGRAGENNFQLLKNLCGRDGGEAKIGGLTDAHAGATGTRTPLQHPMKLSGWRPPRG
jgi:hypothetical protein